MKRAAAALLIATSAACASGGGAPPTWATTVATLSDHVTPGSANPCNRGAPTCLDIVVAEMARRVDAHAAACDHRVLFELAYLYVTRGIRDAERSDAVPGQAEYLRHLDAVFARYYFTAADALQAGDTGAAPRAWQIAYAESTGRTVDGLGDLLLGMNAHISRDLAFAVATTGLTLPGGGSARAAFEKVNDVIAAVQAPMLAEESRRFDPALSAVDVSRIAPAAKSVGDLLATWRDEAWSNAERLSAASAADRPAVADAIERDATTRALAIGAATHYVPFVTSSSSRDQYCAVHHR